MLRIREFEERVKRTFLEHPGVIRGHTHLADGVPVLGADVALHHEIPAAQGGPRERAGVVVDDDNPGHHVLGDRRADPPGDLDLRTVDQPAAEVTEASLEADPAAGEDRHPERMPRARVQHGDVAHPPFVDQPAQLRVDLPRGQIARVEHGPAVLDLRGLGHRVVELDQAALVHPRLFGHLVHTCTSPS